ncbi:hypothetical protein [Leptothermofonsia sp. ETS-13]|uniref:hypothetical protein n=1 Tax=Leptothermofonsia sp. ETS-13 TaxID=3035696 RepID=UPI003B9E29FA
MLIFLLVGIIGITLLSLTRYVGWNLLLELASHFQRQYLMASLCLLALLVLTRQKKLLLVGLSCLAIILIEILPWYMPQAKAAEVKEGEPSDIKLKPLSTQ